jgi:chromosome segregation ATPase
MTTARVFSIDSLEALHASLSRFGDDAREALASAALEIRRAQSTVEAKLKFWLREIDRCREEVNRAKADLSFRKSTLSDKRSGATEQELALKKAQIKLKEAEEKAATCRRWLTVLPDAIKDYEGPARQLGGFLDGEARRGLELLKKQSETLKDYASMSPPSPATGGPA